MRDERFKVTRSVGNPYRRSRVVRRADGVTIGFVMYSSAGIGGWAYAPLIGHGGNDYRFGTQRAACEALWERHGEAVRA